MTRLQVLFVLVVATPCLAWLDPARDRIAEGNRLFERGDYAGAVEKYGQSLVDEPESPLLNFNMGTAHYKAGNYADAAASFGRVRSEGDPIREARTAYNLGNTQYRAGLAAETQNPEQAMQAYGAALIAYRRAISLNPTDADAKFNYEFVARKLEELQQKQQEDQQQQDSEDGTQEEPSDEAEPASDPSEENAGEEEPEPSTEGKEEPGTEQASPETPGTNEPQDQQAEQSTASSRASEEGEMSPQEAGALLDTAMDDEVQPDEFARQVQGAVVAEPVQDW